MPTELLRILSRRRDAVDRKGQMWESTPHAAATDASHLAGCSFDAPSSAEWLKSLAGTPEEDLFSVALLEELANRGLRPAHAPVVGSEECRAAEGQLQEATQALVHLQKSLVADQEKLSSAREEIARREAELAIQEAALQTAKHREECSNDCPQPEWLDNLDGTMNIAVVGNSGVGKSLLINCLRKLKSGSPGWAPVGVNETTLEPSMYCYSGAPQVRIWDLPGAGTPSFPSETYVRDMGLRYFDRVVIVTAGRFTEMELELQKELASYRVPYVMVRNKVDLDVLNNRIDNGKDEESTLAEIAANVQEAYGSNVYLVSSREGIEKYDMPQLLSDIFPCLRNQLSADAVAFCPGGSNAGEAAKSSAGWDDAWAMPEAHSPVLSSIQGLWRDHEGSMYLVRGTEVHVTSGDRCTVVNLFELPNCICWGREQRWYITQDSVQNMGPNRTHGLQWLPKSSKDQPVTWQWSQ